VEVQVRELVMGERKLCEGNEMQDRVVSMPKMTVSYIKGLRERESEKVVKIISGNKPEVVCFLDGAKSQEFHVSALSSERVPLRDSNVYEYNRVKLLYLVE